MKSFKLILLITLIPIFVIGQTDFQGGIYSNQSWTKENSPYIIRGDVVVFPSTTLTIEPGVEIRFDGFYYLEIRGTINALGNEIDSIKFTSNSSNPAKGDWNGIPLKTEPGAKGNFGFCEFSYADKLNTVEICLECDPIYFNNCLFDNIEYVFSDYGTIVLVDNCTFTNNRICATDADRTISNSVFIGNEYGIYESEDTNITR